MLIIASSPKDPETQNIIAESKKLKKQLRDMEVSASKVSLNLQKQEKQLDYIESKYQNATKALENFKGTE